MERGAGLFSLIQLSHMLTVILSPLSKAAGTIAIISPLPRPHVSWGYPEDKDEIVESQGQCDGEGSGQGDWETDQGRLRKRSARSKTA